MLQFSCGDNATCGRSPAAEQIPSRNDRGAGIDYRKAHGVPVSIRRPPGVAGPGGGESLGRWIDGSPGPVTILSRSSIGTAATPPQSPLNPQGAISHFPGVTLVRFSSSNPSAARAECGNMQPSIWRGSPADPFSACSPSAASVMGGHRATVRWRTERLVGARTRRSRSPPAPGCAVRRESRRLTWCGHPGAHRPSSSFCLPYKCERRKPMAFDRINFARLGCAASSNERKQWFWDVFVCERYPRLSVRWLWRAVL